MALDTKGKDVENANLHIIIDLVDFAKVIAYWRSVLTYKACPDSPAGYFVLIFILPILLILWILQSVSRNFKSGSLAIGFDFLQGL